MPDLIVRPIPALYRTPADFISAWRAFSQQKTFDPPTLFSNRNCDLRRDLPSIIQVGDEVILGRHQWLTDAPVAGGKTDQDLHWTYQMDSLVGQLHVVRRVYEHALREIRCVQLDGLGYFWWARNVRPKLQVFAQRLAERNEPVSDLE